MSPSRDGITRRSAAVIFDDRGDYPGGTHRLVFRERPSDGDLIFQEIHSIAIPVKGDYDGKRLIRLLRGEEIVLKGHAVFRADVFKVIRHRRRDKRNIIFGECQRRPVFAGDFKVLNIEVLFAERIDGQSHAVILYGNI